MISKQYCYSHPVLTLHPSYKKASLIGGSLPAPATCPSVTFQHADVHRIVGLLWDTEHHFQAIFEFPFALLAAGQQFLRSNTGQLWTISGQHACFISDWFSWQVEHKVATASLTVRREKWTASKHTVDAHRKWGSTGNDCKARQHKVLPNETLHSELI